MLSCLPVHESIGWRWYDPVLSQVERYADQVQRVVTAFPKVVARWQKIQKIQILKIRIRSAQNVGKVWISRINTSWPYLGPSQAFFSIDRN